MITFTKEQLIASAHARIEFAEMMLSGELEPLKERTWSIELELARIALASLELERGMIRRFDLDMSDCDSCGQDCGADMVEDLDGEYVLWDEVLPHLYRHDEYTAPRAPVSVPDELTREEYKRRFMEDDDFDDTFRGGWNACRAAMLQGANGNSPVIPDGSTSAAQFVKDYCKAAGWTEKEFYETQVPMPDITSPSGWAAVSNSPLSIKSHVDLYMRAAPQQEA